MVRLIVKIMSELINLFIF